MRQCGGQHSLFGTPRRFAALPKFGSDRSEADMRTSWRTSEGDGVAHTVGAVTALLEREDYTRVAWYRCLYAPSRGRGYDSHHRTAGIAGCTRRRGGVVAARGTCSQRRSRVGFFDKYDSMKACGATVIDFRRRGRIAEEKKLQCST